MGTSTPPDSKWGWGHGHLLHLMGTESGAWVPPTDYRDLSMGTPCSPVDMRIQASPAPSKDRGPDMGTHLFSLTKMGTPQVDMGPKKPSPFYRD